MKKNLVVTILFLAATFSLRAEKLTAYVNPFLGTAPLTNTADVGFTPPWRVWAGLTFPGASVPNAMVQLSPITKFGSGAGYEYEDSVIHGFAHSNKGHWNLCHIPILPVTGEINPDDFASAFNHKNESAHPGYYQVFLERYQINAELTSTLRCGYHQYTYKKGESKKLVVDLAKSNEHVNDWRIKQDGDTAFKGFQAAGEKVYFYALANHKIKGIGELKTTNNVISVVTFEDANKPLEIQIGLSFISTENAKLNLEKELTGKSFAKVKNEASANWETLLSKIKVSGGTERQKELFYSCLYRSFLWPALRSDVNGEFLDDSGKVVKKDFQYYTIPSLWDDYRNKLVLLGMLSPEVTVDVIKSLIDRGEKNGWIPTFFHGDHAAPFIAGSYLRGLRGYDIKSAYNLLLRNAMVEGERKKIKPHLAEYITKGYTLEPGKNTGYIPTFFPGDHAAPFIAGSYLRGLRDYDLTSAYNPLLRNPWVEWERRGPRPYLEEYINKGYISEANVRRPIVETKGTAGVTKTLEYAYDDYAVALLAKELKDESNYSLLMKRSENYTNLFDPSTGLMRGRLRNGDWVRKFDPQYPYYEYMYREANAWQSSFFAPQNTEGLIKLYKSKEDFEKQLDLLFSIPWNTNYIAMNINSFIGQYCHGNQPDHSFPYLYYFVGKQEKSQVILNTIMSRFYGMGEEGLALCGMDDAGEMSTWYVFNAIGLYPYSPADEDYILSVPLFKKVNLKLDDKKTFTILKKHSGTKITYISYDDQVVDGYFLPHHELAKGKKLVITTK